MRNPETYQTYILGSGSAYTLAAQSSSGGTTFDGTAWVAEFMDDYLFGPQQALFKATGTVYDTNAETADASQWLTATQKYIKMQAYPVIGKSPFSGTVANAASPDEDITITATELYLGPYRFVTGATGMTATIELDNAAHWDTGVIPSGLTSKPVYVHAMCNTAGAAVVYRWSESATAPTLGTYAYSQLVSGVPIDSDGDIFPYKQNDNNCVTDLSLTAGSASATYVELMLANILPLQIITDIYGNMSYGSGSDTSISPTNTVVGSSTVGGSTTTSNGGGQYYIYLTNDKKMYYKSTNGTYSNVRGYKLKLLPPFNQ